MNKYNTDNAVVIMAVLTLCFITFAVETDIYVPAFPEMLDAFGVTENKIQSVLSVNFLGICIGCLFFGPLSDSFGRRLVLLLGLGIFSFASLGSVLIEEFEQLVLFRLIQGVGAGSILAVSSAAIFDRYDASTSAKMLGFLNSIVTMAIGIAPIIGALLTVVFGWRSVFFLVFLLGVTSLIFTFFFLGESHHKPDRKEFDIARIFNSYLSMFNNKRYVIRTLIWTLMASTIFIYTANISIIFVEHLGLALDSFGIYQSLTIGTFSVFSLLSPYFIGRFGAKRTRDFGTCSFIIGSFAFLAIGVVFPSNIVAIAAVMAFISMGCALSMVVYFAQSVEGIDESGTAVALAQAIRLILLFSLVDLSRMLFDGTILSVSAIVFAVAVSVLSLVIIDRSRMRESNFGVASND